MSDQFDYSGQPKPKAGNPAMLDLIAESTRGKNMRLAAPDEQTLQDVARFMNKNIVGQNFGPEQHIAGYEKLTMAERKIMDIMPGVADSAFVKKMGTFSESALGKPLFTILAAGERFAERALGTIYQTVMDDNLNVTDIFTDPEAGNKFKAAWYASEKFYEVIAPEWKTKFHPTDEPGEVTGFVLGQSYIGKALDKLTAEELSLVEELKEINARDVEHWKKVFSGEATSTGGLPQLVALREQIFDGTDKQEAYDRYMESLGALALRGQIWDFFGGVMIDPANMILAILKPVERITAFKHLVSAGRVAPEVVDTMNDVKKVAYGISNVADSADDLAVSANKLKELANTLDIEDFTKIADDIEKAATSGKNLDKALKRMEDFIGDYDLLAETSVGQRKLYALFGGDPLNPSAKLTAASKGKAGILLRMATLTPASRAKLFVNTISDNLRNIISRFDDPAQWSAVLERGAAGSIGKTFGHAFISPVGRQVQNVLKAWTEKGNALKVIWEQTRPMRELAEEAGLLLNRTVPEVVETLGKGGKEAQKIFDALLDLAKKGEPSVLLDAIRTGQLNVESLAKIGQVFKSTGKNIVPYTSDLYRAQLMKDILDTAGKMAIQQFDVKEVATVTKAVNALKAAESLVLLGLNPLYPIKNFFNNEVTMMARGIWNWMGKKQIDEIWEGFGIIPTRIDEAFDTSGEAVGAVARANKEAAGQALRDIEKFRKGDKGVWNTIEKIVRKDPVSIKHWAGNIEQSSSRRATTMGMLKAWDQAKHNVRHMDDVSSGLSQKLNSIDPEYADYFFDAVRSARKPEDLEALRKLQNIKLNSETVLRKTADALGIDPNKMNMLVNVETMELSSHILKNLGENPSPSAIDGAFDQIQKAVQESLEDALAEAIPLRIEELAAMVEFDRTPGVMQIYGEIAEEILSREISHAAKLDDGTAAIAEIEDFATRNAMWEALNQETGAAWHRTWRNVEASYEGIVKGVKNSGGTLPSNFLGSFKKYKKTVQGYVDLKTSAWSDYFKALDAGAQPDVAAVYKLLDDGYDNMITAQAKMAETMDKAMLKSIADPNLRKLNTTWRALSREMRQNDMLTVADFRKSIRNLPRIEKSKAWESFNISRVKAQYEIFEMEQWGRRLNQSDPAAISFFKKHTAVRLARPKAADSVSGTLDDLTTYDPAKLQGLLDEGVDVLDAQRILRSEKFLDAQQELIGVPVAEMPEAMQEALKFEISDMRFELDAAVGDAGGRAIFDDGGKFESTVNSAYPDWYDGLTKTVKLQNGEEVKNIDATLEAMKNIERGEFDTGYKIYEDLKEAAFGRLAKKDLPPDFEFGVDNASYLGSNGIEMPDLGPMPAGNFESVVGRQLFRHTGLDEVWFDKGSKIVNEMRVQSKKIVDAPPLAWKDMPEDVQKGLNRYLDVAAGDVRDARGFATRMAQSYRDSALLNYGMETGFDAFFAHLAPFPFWWTHSVMRWAVHSMDRFGAITTWAKSKEFLDNVVGDRQNIPTRLQGRIKINVPFLPDGFGEAWVDPLKAMGLPFEQLIDPAQNMTKQTASFQGRVDRELAALLENDQITQLQYDEALNGKNPRIIELAEANVNSADNHAEFDILDFMNMSTAPHLPIQYAWQIARGTPEEIGVLPHTRYIHDIAGLLGIDPGYYENTWGNVRRQMGLPGYDKWDEYRVRREISNMAGESRITADEAQIAMSTMKGQIYDEAIKRVTKNQGWSSLFNLIGLPTQPYPPGEKKLRGLYDEFYESVAAYDNGDPEKIAEFFEENPSFETRLALWKEPEEQMKQFVVDNIWDTYSNMTKLDKDILKEEFGDEFVAGFLDQDTASVDVLSVEQLTMWLQRMTGNPDRLEALGNRGIPLEYAPPEIAHTAEAFYQSRNFHFESWFDDQDAYFKLAKGAPRRQYIAANPQLKAYWDWRNSFLKRNPDAAPYIDDNFEPNYKSITELEAAEANQPNIQAPELSAYIYSFGDSAFQRRLDDVIARGASLSPAMEENLAVMAANLGMTVGQIIQVLREEAFSMAP